MRVALLTLRYSPTLGGFDDTALRELSTSRDLVSFREHFFSVQDVPHLLCVAYYQPQPLSGTEQPRPAMPKK